MRAVQVQGLCGAIHHPCDDVNLRPPALCGHNKPTIEENSRVCIWACLSVPEDGYSKTGPSSAKDYKEGPRDNSRSEISVCTNFCF